MPNRLRDLMTEPLTMEYVKRRMEEGWMVTAVEWIKPGESKSAREQLSEDVPYGQKISADCKHLTEDEVEMDTLYAIYEKVIAGWRPTQIATDLNTRQRTTRAGSPWTPNAVFDLMPRLIELSPRLQVRPDWPARRASLEIVT